MRDRRQTGGLSVSSVQHASKYFLVDGISYRDPGEPRGRGYAAPRRATIFAPVLKLPHSQQGWPELVPRTGIDKNRQSPSCRLPAFWPNHLVQTTQEAGLPGEASSNLNPAANRPSAWTAPRPVLQSEEVATLPSSALSPSPTATGGGARAFTPLHHQT